MISFKFFVCFIFNVSLGSAPKRKNFDIQCNTRVASGGQFTLNYHTPSHMWIPKYKYSNKRFFKSPRRTEWASVGRILSVVCVRCMYVLWKSEFKEYTSWAEPGSLLRAFLSESRDLNEHRLLDLISIVRTEKISWKWNRAWSTFLPTRGPLCSKFRISYPFRHW